MPLFRSLRGRFAFHRSVAAIAGLWLSCSAPDDSALFRPLPSARAGAGGTGGAAPTTAGSAGLGGGAGAGSGGMDQGGAPPVAGAGGVADEWDASAGGAPLDAGTGEDAGSTPPACEDPGPERCNGLDDDCDGIVDPAGTCPEDCASFTSAERGYMFCADPADRDIALASCAAQQMRLAWIESEEENEALVTRIAGLGLDSEDEELLVHIGASDAVDEGEWTWLGNSAAPDGPMFWEGDAAEDGGEPVEDQYQAWGSGEPNDQGGEDCGVLSVLGGEERDPGQWDDRDCTLEFAFLCEIP